MRKKLVAGLAGLPAVLLALPATSAEAADPDWVKAAEPQCYSGGVDGWSLYTWCWGKRVLKYDGNPDRDYYSFRMTSSGQSTDGKNLQRLWVEMDPRDSSPNMWWEGTRAWAPRETVKIAESCKQVTSSVAGTGKFPATYSTSSTVCSDEQFGPKLYTEQGHHAGIWKENGVCVGDDEVRFVYATVFVRVNQGKVPLWSSDRHGAEATKGC